ncbi:hypothetical protein Athai_46030 [Actinocatenispora thailandica]|uniref:Uncharacterized protein n=1 Tax=Actinocatenispora thailandica TaxID=227318 RepID=A0A7R7DT00_9ACTN|nr:hypothetical protein [Actinocatenispora thailandica]BCJ37100.1 hypothetical protein Athai_46030 [Actinocatenispora thailandica]
MSDRAVWLLDIDGVLNVLGGKPDRRVWPSRSWRRFSATDASTQVTWPIVVAEPVAAFIREVHDSGRAEVRWHTTWQRSAGRIGAQLGLPEFEVHSAPEFPDGRYDPEWWKLPGALRVIEDERRPLIWTDDQATPRRIPPSQYDRVNRFPNLLIAPRDRIALTRRHLRAIDRHLDHLASLA